MAQPTRSVLILTQDFDLTADAVIGVLRERGARVVRVDLSYFPHRLAVTASDFDGERQRLRHRLRNDRDVDLSRVSAVWYRRPTEFDFDAGSAPLSGADRQLAHDEALHGIGGILAGMDCVWVNRPDREAVAGLKPYQLHLARRVGLPVPRTVMTNDPAEVETFLARVGRPVVYKPFSGGILHYPDGFPIGLLTTVVGAELHEHLDRVRHTMCIFQEYVDKAYEVRLTVIGDVWFPVVIASQDSDSTRIDWRAADRTGYGDYRPLPDDVVAKVRALLAELGLVYATVDFVVTPAGEHVFLEVNPDGQFMWLKHDLGLPFCEHLADLLAAGHPDRRADTVTQVGY